MSLERSWRALELRIAPLERLVMAVASSLKPPKYYREYTDAGYRYEAPDVRHFCLLKAARVVSALNASVHLARAGYVQEIAVLMRTVIECTTHIEYVLDLDDSVAHTKAVEAYLRAFFEDARRHSEAKIKKAQVPQGKVHETIGRTLDEIAAACGDTKERKPAATLYSHVYRVFSNYVQAKYSECMDMYGGTPGHFHLKGMGGTPKDIENMEQIASSIETASNAFVILIQQLKLMDLLKDDKTLSAWYRERFERD
jgi:hypothetical protein